MTVHSHTGPRAGSRPAIALEKLHLIGGQAGVYGWMRAAAWVGTIAVFERDIARYLERCRLVTVVEDLFTVTQAGRDFMDIEPGAAPLVQPAVAGPRLPGLNRPLAASNMPRLTLTRPGALDYRDIPSLMGGQRVAHGEKISDKKTGAHMQKRIEKTRLLKLPAVLDRVPVSKTEWYRKIKAGTAPAPVSLSARSVAWRESDIDAYIAALPVAIGR